MSKKRAKSGAGSAGPQKWEQAILSTSFYDEEKWSAAVVWIVENQLEDEIHINELAAAVNSGARKLFSHVTKNDLYELVNELGNPKNKGKVKEVPAHSEICEPCRNYLENGEDIPLTLLAKLIKFKLLDIKAKDVRRRDADKKPSTAVGEKGGKGGKGGKGDKDRAKSPAKGAKGGGKKTPEVPSPKGDTKLRRRGEEDTDNKYIDDEPDDGPEHYIFVSGFYQPHLVPLLCDIGVNVDVIIKVMSDDYQVLQPPTTDTAEPPNDEKLQAEEEKRQKALDTKKELKTFWKDVIPLLQKSPEGSKMHDLARLEYVVKTEIIPKNTENPEEKLEFGLSLFEDTACLVYDLLDAKRQWQNFLTNLNLLHVPVIGGDPAATTLPDAQSQHSATPAPVGAGTAVAPGALLGDGEAPAPARPDTDMRYYREMMDTIPQESASVPLIMHCMLEQVVAWEEEKEPPSEVPRPPWTDGVEDSLSSHITSAAFKLALSEEEQQNLASELKVPKAAQSSIRQPLLIDHHDKRSWSLHHLTPLHGFNPQQVEQDMAALSPLSDMIHLRPASAKGSRERAARLQELLHFCSNASLTRSEIDQAFKQFVFESMDLTTVEESGAVSKCKDSNSATNPWDDPYPTFTNQADDTELFEPPPPSAPVVQNTGPVEADKLVKELEAIQAQPVSLSPSPPTRPNSGASGRSSRSRNKKKRVKSPKAKETPASPPPTAEDTSRPNSGILKSTSRSGSRSGLGSRRSSVHFVHNEEGKPLVHPGDEGQGEAPPPTTPRTVDDNLSKVIHLQKRNLDQWCFAEHFEANVLKQVLSEAVSNLPYIDSYYHRKDHTLLLVLHNPSNAALHSTVSWQTNLHSNVGFRNYLEHVAAAVEDWTHTEEAKYEASLLAKEVENIQKEAEMASSSRPASASGKKDRAKSPKKGASRAGRSSSRGSSAERPASTNLFIREGSLKAQKLEMEAQRVEQDEQDKAKNDKRARSGKKSAKDDDKKEKRSVSRSSSKSRISKENVEAEVTEGEPKEQEKQWPFMGYDVGNNMIHVGGTVTTMFPADGGVICVEKTEYVQGTVSVSTTVKKDGHQFMVHVIDPHLEEEGEKEEEQNGKEKAEEGVEKADEEKNEKDEAVKPVGRFGSMVACMNDGMTLAFSGYGPSGEPEQARKEVAMPTTLQTPRTPSPSKAPDSPTKSQKKNEKGKAGTPDPTMTQEDEDDKEEVVEEEPAIVQPFQQLYVTCPDGLNVSFQLESSLGVTPSSEDDRRLAVRQSYPYKTSGEQECESLRKRAMAETSRLITNEGVVICSLEDGVTKLLYPDGKVSVLQALPTQSISSRPSSPTRAGSAKSGVDTPTRKARGKKSAGNTETGDTTDGPKKPQWLTTMVGGERFAHYVDGTKIDTKDALICTATDPQTEQTLHTREDHVLRVTHPDGTSIVEHADGTRITRYTRQVDVTLTEGNKDTGEEPKMEVKEVGFVNVECPGYATVKFNTHSTECSIEFGTGTVINVNATGTYDLYHQDGGYLQVETDGTAVYSPRPNNDLEVHNPDLDMRYLIRHFSDTIVESMDNEGNQFSVRHTGDTNVNLSGISNVTTEEKEVGEEKESVKQVVHYKQHAPRFFIIEGDGSGTELLRYQDVAEYIATAEDDPTTAILMDQIQDCPGVNGLTILKRVTHGISEKWLRPYSQDTIIPPGLTSRDLKTLPPLEYSREGPGFGTNVGQGLMVGSVVKSEPRPPPLKCPSVLEVRRLIQYKPVTEELRESMRSGLREYAKFVQGRQEDTENIQVFDPRSEEEKMNAANIAAMTKNYPDSNTIKSLYEKATEMPVPESAPTPQPKRSRADWERDMREVELEKENKRAMRNHEVPKYFNSELGKAFLLAQAPDLDQLTKQLAAGTLRGSPNPTSESTATPDNRHPEQSVNPSQQSHVTDRSESNSPPYGSQPHPTVPSPYVREYGYTPSSVRPGNPTPAHAAGQGSPAPLRPKNPTPGHAGSMTGVMVDRPGAPTPKEATHNITSETPSSTHPVYPSIPEQPQEEKPQPVGEPVKDDHLVEQDGLDSNINRTLLVDVVGAPRHQPVTVPAYINKNGRPNAISNEKFSRVEDPVRRHVYTSSVAGATSHGAHTLSRMRGFELLPSYVDFGVLKEGNTYAFPVHLKNTGIDACRFKIKQPPPSTGLRVLFRPGPVAAGMKTELIMEVYAIAIGATGEEGVGRMVHNLEITTETDQIFLPVAATILTSQEYERGGRNSAKGDKNPGVKWVSNRPPASQGMIRPRRQESVN